MLQTLISLLISVIVLGIVFWIVDYTIGLIPLPEPFRWIAKVIPALIVLLLVLKYLLPLVHLPS